jgi:ribosomal protein L11 methylase PrmA
MSNDDKNHNHLQDKHDTLGASFRDPSGFLYIADGVLYRQVNEIYREDYDHLMDSGLHNKLVKAGLLIPHEQVDVEPAAPAYCYKTIEPEVLEFISYPYEWSFSQLKDAALTTLKIQKIALEHDMSLKDSSAYNIQFHKGRPVLIDSLSFEKYREGKPWDAYRQFCQHFLAPLSLMAYTDIRLGQLLRIHIDGIPLDLASKLLPARTRFNFSLVVHIHIHASTQQRYASRTEKATGEINRNALYGLIDSLESGVRKLKWEPEGTAWGDYYDATNYTPEGFDHKQALVREFLEHIKPASLWDLGANTGAFSRLASDMGIRTIAFDIDPGVVEKAYQDCVNCQEKHLLPLILDLTNPSPNIGWHLRERASLLERGPADVVLALALIHHLAIANNVPLDRLADFFSDLSEWLVIEFVPKSDSQVERLLATRADIFPEYTPESFERIFASKFNILRSEAIEGSQRRLYLMSRI